MEGKINELWKTFRSSSLQRQVFLSEIAGDLYSMCVEQISETELALAISTLLHSDGGIIKFLKEISSFDEFASCKEQLLILLNDFAKITGKDILPYVASIKEVCVSLFIKDKTAKVQNAIFPLLITVLSLSSKSEYINQLNIPKLSDKFFQAALQPTKHSSTVRGAIYHLLGVLCELFPEHLMEKSPRLVEIYVKTLKYEMTAKKGKKFELSVIAGCLKGLAAYLQSFAESGLPHMQDIYKFIRMSVDPAAHLTRYDTPRSGLTLISMHASHLSKYLTKDFEQIYKSLEYWCNHNNRDCQLIAWKAMDAFCYEICEGICNSNDRKDEDIQIYQFFMKKFHSLIDNPSTQRKQLVIAIRGYGLFAKPCKLFGTTNDIHFMFEEMLQRSEQLFLTVDFSNISDDTIFTLPTFIESLASICQEIEHLPESNLLPLKKLTILLLKCFPLIPPHMKYQSVISTMKLIMSMASTPNVFQQFLANVVYQGVIQSCSFPVVIEAGGDGAVASVVDQELDASSTPKVISYRDYIQLWIQLMNKDRLQGLKLDHKAQETRIAIHSQIYNEFIKSILIILKKLDLSSFTDNEENVITSDPIADKQPSVPRDFQIFINLVELTRKTIPFISPLLFKPWVLTFVKDVISLSSNYPLVSGFYKLLATGLDICNNMKYFQGLGSNPLLSKAENDASIMEVDVDDIDRYSAFHLFWIFAKKVIASIQQYKNDLLASCLFMVLSLPKEMVTSEISCIIPVIQQSFKLGQGYWPLAEAVINSLSSWIRYIDQQNLQELMTLIFPLINNYLKTSVSTSVNLYSESIAVLSVSSSRGKKLPQRVLKQWKQEIAEESSQSTDQTFHMCKRILYFIGSLGGVLTTTIAKEATSHSMTAWDTQNKLPFLVPFSDLKPEIYLDSYLPVVCDIAISSTIRQTKLAACELLHALALFIIGKGAQLLTQKQFPMTKLYRKLHPVFLQLACDIEKVTEQLFQPLVFQMIHWFTKNEQYESPDTIALLESLLDGIENPTNMALRDLSARCVKEYVIWSIKQAPSKKSTMNTKSLLKRLYHMASHPSPYKRLGAALAFNNIYAVFREEESLVDIFVIEMLVVMINSLKLAHKDKISIGTVDQGVLAVHHIIRIIKAKSSLLNKSSKNRRVPHGLMTADLTNLIPWLLTHTGSVENQARIQCRESFINLAPLASSVVNIRTWIRNTIESESGFYFVSRFESCGHRGIQKQPTISVYSYNDTLHFLECIQASLDNYNWILSEQFVSPSELFNTFSENHKSQLFVSIDFFLKKLAMKGLHEFVASYYSDKSDLLPTFTDQDNEYYNSCRKDVVVLLFEFAEILLTKHTNEAVTLCVDLWCDEFYEVLFSCFFNPTGIGAKLEDIVSTVKLADVGQRLLTSISSNFPHHLKATFTQIISSKISTNMHYNLYDNLPQSFDNIDMLRIIRGHVSFTTGGLLKDALCALLVNVNDFAKQLFYNVINLMCNNMNESVLPLHRQFGEELIKLGLVLSENIDAFLEVVISSTDSGIMLYTMFSDIINMNLSSNINPVIDYLVRHLKLCPLKVYFILNTLLDYLQIHKLKSQSLIEVCSSLLCQMEFWVHGDDINSKSAAVAVLSKLLKLQPKIFLTLSKDQYIHVIDMYCQYIKDKSLPLSFKSKLLVPLSSFLLPSLDFEPLIRDSLYQLVALQFPIKSTELSVGGLLYNEYINIIDKFLSSLVSSGNLTLLEVVINIMCREEKHIQEEKIQASLIQFITKLSREDGVIALTSLYKMFCNDQKYPLSARRAIAERVFLPLMKNCSPECLVEFFQSHICDIMDVLECKVLKNSDSALEDQLVCKICCFRFIEVLYFHLHSSALSTSGSKLNSKYCKGEPKTGKELTQAITKCGHAAKSENLTGDQVYPELRRQYHCFAYNMLVAVISCTQTKLQFYSVFLFKEDVSKGQYLWDNLIDPDKEYNFPIELETPLDRKKQIMAIKDELKQTSDNEAVGSTLSPERSPLIPPRYISTQYLADSSLTADVSQYDFSVNFPIKKNIPKSPSNESGESHLSSYVISEEELELDGLNTHECMLVLMNLLDHMQHNKIIPEVTEDGSREMPSWMDLLYKKMTENTNKNIRLFLARLIVNRSKIFRPYAKHWLPVLTQLIISGESGEGLHYFIVDIIATMLSWATTAILQDRHLASQLLSYCMKHANHENRSIFRNNLEMIKLLVEHWRDYIQVPTKIIYDQFSNPSMQSKSNRTGIQLLGVIVANQLPPFDIATAGILSEQQYYTTFISNLSYKYKEVYGATAEVIGMVLYYLSIENHSFFHRCVDLVTEKLMVLAQPSERSEDKFIICLHKIQQYFSMIVEKFIEKLLFMLPTFHGVFRSYCLEVIQSQADVLPDFYHKLKDLDFHGMLTHRDEPTQIACLEIVRKMLVKLDDNDILQLLPILISSFGKHNSKECRLTLYNILISTYNKYCDENLMETSDDVPQQILSKVKNQLLLGLSDDFEDIKYKIYEFWNQESNLSSNTILRLSQLFSILYSNDTEQQFLHNSTNFLLELTSRSPDFNISLFDNPLSACKFEKYSSFDLSWQQRHYHMTPLFASTQLSQSQTSNDVGTVRMESGLVQATQQSLAFTPTQNETGYSWMAPTAQSLDSASFNIGTSKISSTSDNSHLLFTPPTRRPPLKDPLRVSASKILKLATQDEQEKQVQSLKRRFFKNKEMISSIFAKSQAKKNIMREEQRRRQKATRQNYVVMYREYRIGELPDIQIKHSELIRPLQALAQNDIKVARLLFGSLFNSIFAKIDHELTEEETKSTKDTLNNNFNTILDSSTQYYPPFIASLMDIGWKESGIKLQPSSVSNSCLVCSEELIGIMLLEEQLIASDDGLSVSKSKKPRLSMTVNMNDSTDAWVQLARLYKSLNEYDVVRGIFSNLDGIKTDTRKAFEAEERGDYVAALYLYTNAIDGDWKNNEEPSQVEEDLWEDSLLNAYCHLTKWKDLEKSSISNIDDHSSPQLSKLWEDAYYQEHYLPYVLLSKLKLWCNDGNDRGLIAFIDESLQQETSRSLLESRYSEQLAQAYILRNDFKKSQYYINLSLQSVLQNWSSMDIIKLSSSGIVQSLQQLTEMNEFINFMNTNGDQNLLKPLLSKWNKRLPDSRLDSIIHWDNVITYRSMMLHKIALKCCESTNHQREEVKLLIDTECTNMYMELAKAACIQHNYTVSEKYFGLVDKSVKLNFPDDLYLQIKWLHNVVHMRLQQIQQDLSPKKARSIILISNNLVTYNDSPSLASNKSLASHHYVISAKLLCCLAEMYYTSEEDSELANDLISELSYFAGEDHQLSFLEVAKKLWIHSMVSLDNSVKISTVKDANCGKLYPSVESLEEFFIFCDNMLRKNDETDVPGGLMDITQFPSIIVNHTFTAMCLGSKKAREIFPRLLQLIESYPDTIDLFISKSSEVPCWMFISWINQMVALLDKPESKAIINILHRIANMYPQALYFPFNVSNSGYKFEDSDEGKENRDNVQRLKDKLHNQLLEDFIAALELLNTPELAWKVI
jgi:DNA-dependent protein kinase catalytic subunit